MDQDIINALIIMGKGMLAIFIVIIVLTIIVVLLTKITNLPLGKNKKESNE
jgi:hypothetical protein